MPSTRQMHLTGSTRHCDQYGDNRLSKGSRRKLLSSVRRISLLHADRLRFGLQSRRRWLSLRAAPFRRRREGGAHAQNSSHCFVDMLSGLARYGVCNAHRLERVRSQKPPTHKSCPHVADVAPADIAGHMAAAGGTAGKTPKRGSIGSSRWISGSGLPVLVRGLTFTVEAGVARPNRRIAHRS